MDTVAIVVGAGAGRRMGKACKALLDLEGKPVLCYSLEALERSGLIDGVCVVVPQRLLEYFEREFTVRWPFKKVFAWVAGGERRQDSVDAALKIVPDEVSWIAVHDAARPFLSQELLERVMDAARGAGAAVPGIKPTDTIKVVGNDGFAARTLDREGLAAVQTPQVFSAELLRKSYRGAEKAGRGATDDASLLEMRGCRVAVVRGSRSNIKITMPEDLEYARYILREIRNPDF